MLYRHGDVLVQRVSALPRTAEKRSGTTLAYGELTGHSHRIEDAQTVQFWRKGHQSYFEVLTSSARLIHEEHGTIVLPQGVYRNWMQREYTPQAIVRVRD